MGIETASLNQKAVLWQRTSFDRNGEPRVSAPVEIKARWEEGLLESIDEEATPIAINGTVDVDRDIKSGSIMWLGKLRDLPSPVTEGLVQVVGFEKIPDIKGRVFARSVTVKKWRNKLPTVE